MSIIDEKSLIEAVADRVLDRMRSGDPAVEPFVDAVAARLQARDGEPLLDRAGLAQLLSCSPAAVEKRVQRDHELDALAVRQGRLRYWRRHEVLSLLDRRRKPTGTDGR